MNTAACTHRDRALINLISFSPFIFHFGYCVPQLGMIFNDVIWISLMAASRIHGALKALQIFGESLEKPSVEIRGYHRAEMRAKRHSGVMGR